MISFPTLPFFNSISFPSRRPKQKGKKIKRGRREREGGKAQTEREVKQVGKMGKGRRVSKAKGKRKEDKEGKEKGREGKKREEITEKVTK